jgi:choice-of-anchor B domain-containing protein
MIRLTNATLLFILLFLAACSNNSSDSNPDNTEDDLTPDQVEANFPCTNGEAVVDGITYPCNNLDVVGFVSTGDLLAGVSVGSVFLNDIWGWTDPVSGKEYAMVGLVDGVTFVDISDPANPLVLGKLEQPAGTSKIAGENVFGSNPGNPSCWFKGGTDIYSEKSGQGAGLMASTWRDLKVFNDHVFVVADGQSNHGMQVFDLTRLRDVQNPPVTFNEDALYNDIGSAHNIAINEESGFAYLAGVRRGQVCTSAGLHIVDINDPLNPVFAGCYNEPESRNFGVGLGYIHDTQCIIYNGPDTDYTGSEICFSASEEGFTITDVTDKANLQTIRLEETGLNSYAHQGWLTEDRRFYLMNDELDEFNSGLTTRTFVFNVEDLDNPEFVGTHNFPLQSVDHNLYIKDDLVFESNYTSGLRVLDINNVASAGLVEIAYFDTFPLHNGPGFLGSWSNYPYFESGNIIVSDIQSGLFILRLNRD